MKLTTNFAAPVRKTILAIYLISISVSIAGLMLIYQLGVDSNVLISENTTMKRVVVSLDDKASTIVDSSNHVLAVSDVMAVRRRIEQINSLTPIKSISTNQVLAAIEDIIPDGVRIERLSYSAIDGQLHMVTETKDADLIYLFMNKFEQHSMFSSPELHQKPASGLYHDQASLYEIHAVVRK
jgi:hypothetical protein